MAEIETQRLDSYRRLVDIARDLASTLDLDTLLYRIVTAAAEIADAEAGSILLYDGTARQLYFQVATNIDQPTMRGLIVPLDKSIAGWIVNNRKTVRIEDAHRDDRFFRDVEQMTGFQTNSLMGVPLITKEKVVGVLEVLNKNGGKFTDQDENLLLVLGAQAAVAIENARLFSSLRRTLSEVTALKNLMENVFASITSGVITTDVQEQVTLANRAAEQILGRTAQELLGHRVDDALAPVSEAIRPHLASVRQTDAPVMDLEFNPTLPSRGNVNLRFNLSPLKDESQKTQGIAIVLDDLTERKRLEAQRKLFERMVSPAVIHQLDPNKLQLGGKRTEITVIFADIRGFTSFSEKQSPEKLVSILNLYLAALAEAVLMQEGTIDKFMGDAIMAWFNAPIPQPDHTLRAVKAALAMRAAVENLYTELPPDSHLAFGAGIHFGDAVLGLIGTEKRLEYTAISDSVNITKRIQENSARNQILLSREAYERVKKFVNVSGMSRMPVKGKTQPLDVFEVLGLQ